MARQRRELRISLVVRSDAAPKVVEMLTQVERGRLNGRVVELLNIAVGDGPLPPSSLACLERIERTLQALKEQIAVLVSGEHAPRPARRRETSRDQVDERSHVERVAHDTRDDLPSADSISDAGRLLDNLGVED